MSILNIFSYLFTNKQTEPLGTGTLVATGCGTAIAAVCIVGLFQIENLIGGIWAIGVILIAGLLCKLLAHIFAHLVQVIPSGAGIIAYLSKGFNRSIGLVIVVPYLFLTLFLVGAEATIVGNICKELTGLPILVCAVIFLLGTWMLCRIGLSLSYKVQSIATWLLITGLSFFSFAAIYHSFCQGTLANQLLRTPPTVEHFIAAIGQALFLFMGFELLTSQVEISKDHKSIGKALRISVVVLAIFYSIISLGFSCIPFPITQGEIKNIPQLFIAQQVGGVEGRTIIALLCLLASFTSFNGALLTLSRFTQALATQKVLPQRFARLDPHTLVPKNALTLLLIISILATGFVAIGDMMKPAIFAAGVSAAFVYAGISLVRERSPFINSTRSIGAKITTRMLFIILITIGIGIILDAGVAQKYTLIILCLAFCTTLLGIYKITFFSKQQMPSQTNNIVRQSTLSIFAKE